MDLILRGLNEIKKSIISAARNSPSRIPKGVNPDSCKLRFPLIPNNDLFLHKLVAVDC